MSTTIHKSVTKGGKIIQASIHGTISCYCLQRCRCVDCKAAQAEYMAKYRIKVKERAAHDRNNS